MSATRGIRRAQSGQAANEYLVVLFGTVLVLLGVLGPLRIAIGQYLEGIYVFVGLPFP